MSAAPQRWVAATGNRGKLREMQAILAPAGIELVSQSELGIAPPAETGLTFLENALLKARHAAASSGLPAVADDSGLCVDALQGAPGVHSARFAGALASDAQNVEKLLAVLAHVPAAERRARFYCVMVALPSAQDPVPLVTSGCWRGHIALAAAGTNGFGYDPVFIDPASGLTAAQLPSEIKNARSHRGRALRRLVEALRAHDSRVFMHSAVEG
jgi:XTP/dITP diphosphohydrolase